MKATKDQRIMYLQKQVSVSRKYSAHMTMCNLELHRKLDRLVEAYAYCHPCQVKRGGKMPRKGMKGITVTLRICQRCGASQTLIPTSDYNWKHKKAVFD